MFTNLISRFRSFYVYPLLVFISLLAGISFLPLNANDPHPDSGIFLYIGQQILNGSTLYADLWDNKGPVLYYINALALLIGNGTVWGLYFTEFLSLFIAVLLGYLVIEKELGRIPAIFASIIWPLALFYLYDKGGNFTEEYSLSLGFAAVYLYLRSVNSQSSLIYIFLIGVTFSITLMLRPNNTGIEVSIALLIFISGILSRNFYLLVKQILAYGLGAVLVLAAVLFYFHQMKALGDFYDSFVRYNSIYSVTTMSDRISSLLFGLRLLSPSGLPIVAIAAWIAGVFTLLNTPDGSGRRSVLIPLAVIGLPVELIFSSASGLTFSHYYICWLPIFAVLISFFIYGLIINLTSTRVKIFHRKINLGYIWVFGFFIAMSCLAVVKIPGRIEAFVSSSGAKSPVVEAIGDSSDGEQYLLMWGAAAYFNFVTGMKSPTRFFHQLPLYLCAYTTDDMIGEFLDDIKQRKPLIVDTSATDIYLPPLDRDERKKWQYIDFTEKKNENCTMRPKMEDVFDYIGTNYKLVSTTEPYGWKIYKFEGGN